MLKITTVTLRAVVEGTIKYCPWREGDVIEKAGQKIIEIYRPLYQQQLAVAKAEPNVKKAILEDLKFGPRPEEIVAAKEAVINFESCTKFAKIDLDRVVTLVKTKVVSKQEEARVRVGYKKWKS